MKSWDTKMATGGYRETTKMLDDVVTCIPCSLCLYFAYALYCCVYECIDMYTFYLYVYTTQKAKFQKEKK